MNINTDFVKNAVSTCIDMLIQRNYIYFYDDLNIAENEEGDQIMVFILSVGKLTIEQIKHYIGNTIEHNINHCIILFNDTITPIARKHIFNIPNVHCELFAMAELQYNITKHILVPPHTKITDKQAATLKAKYGKKFPVLNIFEPVARFYDYRIGDVIRIKRHDDIVAYRIVST